MTVVWIADPEAAAQSGVGQHPSPRERVGAFRGYWSRGMAKT